MQWGILATGAVGSARQHIPAGYVLEVSHASPPPGIGQLVGDSPVLQSVGGVGGMLMAGALLVVLGLAAVGIWQGYASTAIERLFGEATAPGADRVEMDEGRTETDGDTVATGAQVEGYAEPETAEPTDQEVIFELLEDNDGRMKQARIVDATGWSKSKVSMLLSEMEDEGEITKLRVGRENIISLSGSEPDAAGSPFDSS